MRRLLSTCSRLCLSLVALSLAALLLAALPGCGGHEGGVVDIPLNENPYQISELEQRQINASIDETKDLTEEEIAELEEAKQQEQAPDESP